MPLVDDLTGRAPEQPHLGLLTGKGGETIAIPPGATMYLIMNPRHIDGVLPMILTKVTWKHLEFACACGQPHCTRRFSYRLQQSGHHPDKQKQQAKVQEKG